MAIALGPALEQRIQRELDRGHYGSPAEVIAHALDLLDDQEEWYARPRHSTPEGRAQAIAILERNAAGPAEPDDILPE